jgi:hypothetical protein
MPDLTEQAPSKNQPQATTSEEAASEQNEPRPSKQPAAGHKAPFPQALCDLLDAPAQLFLKTLYQRGWMPLYDLLTLFQMPRAKTLGRILEPIQRQLQKLGIEKPFSKEIVGHWRIYVWSGVELPGEVPEPTERTPKTQIRKRRNPKPGRRNASAETAHAEPREHAPKEAPRTPEHTPKMHAPRPSRNPLQGNRNPQQGTSRTTPNERQTAAAAKVPIHKAGILGIAPSKCPKSPSFNAKRPPIRSLSSAFAGPASLNRRAPASR